MDGPALSGREQRILTEIENDLRADERLDRELSTMRPCRLLRIAHALGRAPAQVLGLMLALSAALLVVATRVHEPGALAAFGLVWLTTLALVGARLTPRSRGRGR